MRNSVDWCGDHIEIIDQTLLPERLEIRSLLRVDDVVDAIRRLAVRGAPAIGVTAAYGVVLGLDECIDLDEVRVRLSGVRPTAVNLAWAVDRVTKVAREGGRDAALEEAVRIQDEDREACRRIGDFGRAELATIERVMTHCNTGRLATSGIGTALGVVYAKAEAGEPIEVVATETRPLLQGARLTAWELADAGIPVTLIADGAAGAAMSSGRVQAVLLGCDRVARNGDTANKIGTYNLAALARITGLPFYVAGPMTSFDPATPDGEAIEIELREHDEVRRLGSSRVAPEVEVWNPAFDVTPASLITAFITDAGVLKPPFTDSIARALDDQSR
ncbi:MAG: S-methyl-5-thioribose-1-phosphate isomerase [Actinomycetota bacterium]